MIIIIYEVPTTGLATSWWIPGVSVDVSCVGSLGGRDELTKGSNDLTQRNDESSRTFCPLFDCSATRRYTLVCHFHFPRAKAM